MDEEFLDRIDRLLNPEGATETGALLGATMTPGALVKDLLMGDEKQIVAYGDDVLDIISRDPVFSGGIKSLRSR